MPEVKGGFSGIGCYEDFTETGLSLNEVACNGMFVVDFLKMFSDVSLPTVVFCGLSL
jgi:hypothetical protein